MAIYPAEYTFTFYANLAQLVEHFIRNERVVGSNPIVGSTNFPGVCLLHQPVQLV